MHHECAHLPFSCYFLGGRPLHIVDTRMCQTKLSTWATRRDDESTDDRTVGNLRSTPPTPPHGGPHHSSFPFFFLKRSRLLSLPLSSSSFVLPRSSAGDPCPSSGLPLPFQFLFHRPDPWRGGAEAGQWLAGGGAPAEGRRGGPEAGRWWGGGRAERRRGGAAAGPQRGGGRPVVGRQWGGTAAGRRQGGAVAGRCGGGPAAGRRGGWERRRRPVSLFFLFYFFWMQNFFILFLV